MIKISTAAFRLIFLAAFAFLIENTAYSSNPILPKIPDGIVTCDCENDTEPPQVSFLDLYDDEGNFIDSEYELYDFENEAPHDTVYMEILSPDIQSIRSNYDINIYPSDEDCVFTYYDLSNIFNNDSTQNSFLTYDVCDDCGNCIEFTIQFPVPYVDCSIDNQPPTLSMPDNLTLDCASAFGFEENWESIFEDEGISFEVSDNCSDNGDIEVQLIYENIISTGNCSGSFTAEYSFEATDQEGYNSELETVTIEFTDTNYPHFGDVDVIINGVVIDTYFFDTDDEYVFITLTDADIEEITEDEIGIDLGDDCSFPVPDAELIESDINTTSQYAELTYQFCDECGNCEQFIVAIFFPYILGCTDETSCNYNPWAAEDDGSCNYVDTDGDGICDADEILGCTTEGSCNYNPNATDDDGSCSGLPQANCSQCVGENLVLIDSDGDGVCDADEILGCTFELSCNYNPLATDNDGSCTPFPEPNCSVCNGDELVLIDSDGDGLCDGYEISGCTTPGSCNYYALATDDDGSCTEIPVAGCTECSGNTLVLIDSDGDGVCDGDEILGCTTLGSCNYNPNATDDDGSCTDLPEPNCTECSGNSLVVVDSDGDGVCDGDEILGCTTVGSCNYNPNATDDDGSCTDLPEPNCTECSGNSLVLVDSDGDGVCDGDEILGCTTVGSCNYNPNATDDDGSCTEIPEVGCTECSGNSLVLIDSDGDGVCDGDESISLQGEITIPQVCLPRGIEVSLYIPESTLLIEEHSTTVDASGNFSVTLDAEPGNYDVYIKLEHHLSKGYYNVSIGSGEPGILEISNLKIGDLNEDDLINFIDGSGMGPYFNSSIGDENYNISADNNCDGTVNFVDGSVLGVFFGESGDAP